MNGKIELVLLPVADPDRAKQFYLDRCGFDLIVDSGPSDTFRIIQCLPHGSACAIGFGTGLKLDAPPGTVKGLHLVVTDIVAARDELIAGGVDVDPIVNFTATGEQREGLSPNRADYMSFASFADPDGNSWLLQERGFAG